MALLISTPILCQESAKAHVAVVQLSNDTGSSSYNAACKTVTDTLVLPLQRIGSYSVRSVDRANQAESELRALAEVQNFDFILYRTMSAAASGGIQCEMAVYDRAKAKTSLSKTEKAAGILDIFEAVDNAKTYPADHQSDGRGTHRLLDDDHLSGSRGRCGAAGFELVNFEGIVSRALPARG